MNLETIIKRGDQNQLNLSPKEKIEEHSKDMVQDKESLIKKEISEDFKEEEKESLVIKNQPEDIMEERHEIQINPSLEPEGPADPKTEEQK